MDVAPCDIDEQPQPQKEFRSVHDDVKSIIKQCVDKTLGASHYDAANVDQWSSQICDALMERLTKDLSKELKPYKFVVNSIILPKNGDNLYANTACYWNIETDGSCSVHWENDSMHCIVSVFVGDV